MSASERFPSGPRSRIEPDFESSLDLPPVREKARTSLEVMERRSAFWEDNVETVSGMDSIWFGTGFKTGEAAAEGEADEIVREIDFRRESRLLGLLLLLLLAEAVGVVAEEEAAPEEARLAPSGGSTIVIDGGVV